jgi:hypothetical protein
MTNTVKAKCTMHIGSPKNGFIYIHLDEEVEVLKESKNSYQVVKNGISKLVSKKNFY